MKCPPTYHLLPLHGALLGSALLLTGCAADTAVLQPAPTRVEPPPGDVLVKPGPNAADELDPALFAGLPPQARAELGLPATPEAGQPTQPVRTTRTTTSSQATRESPRRTARPAKHTQKATLRIASVAVVEVKGAPGKGNTELARALRLVLRKAGWPVHAKARRDSMRISGLVELGPKTPRGQRVSLKWTARAPNGKLLGVIRQNNIVPSGSLDKGFGAAALPAAEGAADGIFQIVRRLQRG